MAGRILIAVEQGLLTTDCSSWLGVTVQFVSEQLWLLYSTDSGNEFICEPLWVDLIWTEINI